mgnify:FL=1
MNKFYQKAMGFISMQIDAASCWGLEKARQKHVAVKTNGGHAKRHIGWLVSVLALCFVFLPLCSEQALS